MDRGLKSETEKQRHVISAPIARRDACGSHPLHQLSQCERTVRLLGRLAVPGSEVHTMASASRRAVPNVGDSVALDTEQDVQSAAVTRALHARRERARYLALLKEHHAATKPLHPCVGILVILVMTFAIERLSTLLWGDEVVVHTSMA